MSDDTSPAEPAFSVAKFHVFAIGQEMNFAKVLYELKEYQLRGDYAGNGHVIGLTERLTLLNLSDQLCNGLKSKQTGFSQGCL